MRRASTPGPSRREGKPYNFQPAIRSRRGSSAYLHPVKPAVLGRGTSPKIESMALSCLWRRQLFKTYASACTARRELVAFD